MLHALGVKIALFGQISHTAITASFFIRRAADLDSALKLRANFHERLGSDNRTGQPALHIASPAPIDAPVFQLAAERVKCPAMADLDHIRMVVEMHAIAGANAFAPRDNVPARICLAIPRRAGGADQFGLKPRAP